MHPLAKVTQLGVVSYFVVAQRVQAMDLVLVLVAAKPPAPKNLQVLHAKQIAYVLTLTMGQGTFVDAQRDHEGNHYLPGGCQGTDSICSHKVVIN